MEQAEIIYTIGTYHGSLQIFLVEDTILHMKDLGLLPHLCEVRVDDVDDELVLGGTWRSHGT